MGAPADDFNGAEHTMAMLRTPRRRATIEELFDTIDRDKDHRLNFDELLDVARLDGFHGTKAQWKHAFDRLAQRWFPGEYSCSKDQFVEMVNDMSEDGFYMTDDSLKIHLDKAKADNQIYFPSESSVPAG